MQKSALGSDAMTGAEGFPLSPGVSLVVGTKNEACAVLPKPSSSGCVLSPCTGTVALTLQMTDGPPPVLPGGCMMWLVWAQLLHWVSPCSCPHLLLPPLAGTDLRVRVPALDF